MLPKIDLRQFAKKQAAVCDLRDYQTDEETMITETINAFCDVCGNVASPCWSDIDDKIVYCTDDYLRKHGFDPKEVSDRFAEMAKATFADFINLPDKKQ